DLVMSRDQEQLVDEASRLLADRFPIARLRAKTEGPAPDTLADALLDAGWLSVAAPEDVGGAGLGVVEEALLFQAFGRYLSPPSVLATTLAIHGAHHAGERDLAARIAQGQTRVAFAQATSKAGSFLVFELERAEVVLAADAAGVTGIYARDDLRAVTPHESAVDGVRLHRLEFPANAIVRCADEALALRARLLSAALLAGLCAAARDLAADYAKMRVQFGRPIGAFQAIKHKCADLALNADAASAIVNFGAAALAEGQAQAGYMITAAKLLAARNAIASGKECIQVHGAIGWTVECDAHHFLKRAHLYDQICGSTPQQQAFLMSMPAPLS
ncbi:MAG: acyl-CoA dehydrogenase family protein, partial [Caulobacterales bacterium]